MNAVTYDSSELLMQHYAALEDIYETAGVIAWTVWLQEGDEEVAEFLSQKGHQFDGDPVAMMGKLQDLSLPEAGDLRWEETRDMAIIGFINDKAYGFPPPAFEASFQRWPSDSWRGSLAFVDEKPVCGLLGCDTLDLDFVVAAVATLPEFRGRGLATRLMSEVLRAAERRGMKTTSLQASPLGARVYTQLGYQAYGRFPMWERRKSS